MSNVFESINEDAEKLANEYSFLTLKTVQKFMKDKSDYDTQVIETALMIHRERLKNKLDEKTI